MSVYTVYLSYKLHQSCNVICHLDFSFFFRLICQWLTAFSGEERGERRVEKKVYWQHIFNV